MEPSSSPPVTVLPGIYTADSVGPNTRFEPPVALAQARLLETCPAHFQDRLRSLLHSSQSVRFRSPAENVYWRRWGQFAADVGQHPFLPDLQQPHQHVERGNLFLAFALALREGEYDQGTQASSATVEKTLRECALCMSQWGLLDPRRRDPAQKHLDKSFSDAYRRWKDEDPAPRPQQALPNSTVRWIADNYGGSICKRLRMIADLIVLAYFFLLRVGEYTRSARATRTVPLRRQDVKLWRGTVLLDQTLPLQVLLTATSCTINLENQKNGEKCSSLHHTSSGVPGFDPVLSLARLVHEIHDLPASTPLGTYQQDSGRLSRVTAGEVGAAIKLAAVADNLPSVGFSIDRIGTHSLRSGGAVNLKLCGYDHDIIKKFGRWSSDTYLKYIQTQIGELTSGIAARMARLVRFHNVGP